MNCASAHLIGSGIGRTIDGLVDDVYCGSIEGISVEATKPAAIFCFSEDRIAMLKKRLNVAKFPILKTGIDPRAIHAGADGRQSCQFFGRDMDVPTDASTGAWR